MLHIKKQSPPPEMTQAVRALKKSARWKQIKGADTKEIRAVFDDQLPKDVLRKALCREQNCLCAYCMSRITGGGNDTRIEHWYPLHEQMEKDIKEVLGLNGLLNAAGQCICDTNTEIVKGRRTAYERCSRQFERMAAKKTLTSANLKRMIEEIERAAEKGQELPEFIGVTLYRYRKKYSQLLKHNL